MSQPASTDSSKTDIEAGKTGPKSLVARSVEYLQDQVDPKKCIWVSIYACFLTGYTSAMSFSVSVCWALGSIRVVGIDGSCVDS